MSPKPVLVPDDSHPISITPTPGRVVVSCAGRVVADTTRALTLQESRYPAVHYVPLADVDPALLAPSDHATYCPYKGDAGYFALVVDGERVDDAVWTYAAPYDAVREIAGHVAFYPQHVDISVVQSGTASA
jgi:uncharacterized protein (DUF427 family)